MLKGAPGAFSRILVAGVTSPNGAPTFVKATFSEVIIDSVLSLRTGWQANMLVWWDQGFVAGVITESEQAIPSKVKKSEAIGFCAVSLNGCYIRKCKVTREKPYQINRQLPCVIAGRFIRDYVFREPTRTYLCVSDSSMFQNIGWFELWRLSMRSQMMTP